VSTKSDWVELSGCFKAQGGEKFMILGNLRPSEEISHNPPDTVVLLSTYYYIDDAGLEKVNKPDFFFMKNDTSICKGDTIRINFDSNNFPLVKWQDNRTSDSIFLLADAGVYKIEIENQCGTFKDSINIDIITPPSTIEFRDTTICFYDTLTLNAEGQNKDVDYLWNDNSQNSILEVFEEGLFHVKVYNQCGNIYDSTYVNVIEEIEPFNLGNDIVYCIDSVELNLDVENNGDATYLWSDGDTAYFNSVSGSGIH
jgi:hypothetical protein